MEDGYGVMTNSNSDYKQAFGVYDGDGGCAVVHLVSMIQERIY